MVLREMWLFCHFFVAKARCSEGGLYFQVLYGNWRAMWKKLCVKWHVLPSYTFECMGVILKGKVKLSLQSHQTIIISFELLYFCCLKFVDYLFTKLLKCDACLKRGKSLCILLLHFLNFIRSFPHSVVYMYYLFSLCATYDQKWMHNIIVWFC